MASSSSTGMQLTVSLEPIKDAKPKIWTMIYALHVIACNIIRSHCITADGTKLLDHHSEDVVIMG